jgi:hypothetical protein
MDINGKGGFIFPLEVEQYVTDESIPFRFAVILKDAIVGTPHYPNGIHYDSDELAKDQAFLSAVCGAMGARKVKRRRR